MLLKIPGILSADIAPDGRLLTVIQDFTELPTASAPPPNHLSKAAHRLTLTDTP